MPKLETSWTRYRALLAAPCLLAMLNCGGGDEEHSSQITENAVTTPGMTRTVGVRSADDVSAYLAAVLGFNPQRQDTTIFNNYRKALSTGNGISESNIKAVLDVSLRACDQAITSKSPFFPAGINVGGAQTQFDEGLTYATAWQSLSRARGGRPAAEQIQAAITSFTELKNAVEADTNFSAGVKTRTTLKLYCAATIASSLGGVARAN